MEKEMWFDFAGNDSCDGTCKGWDGLDSRCDCGSRRVYWECERDKCRCNKKDMLSCEYAYAVAD